MNSIDFIQLFCMKDFSYDKYNDVGNHGPSEPVDKMQMICECQGFTWNL